MYSRPSHNLPLKYSIILSGFWTATMLANLIPISVTLVFISLFLFYWIDKINLAKRSSVNYNRRISQSFVWFFVDLMPISLILKPIINLILWSTAKQIVAFPQIIMLGLGIIYNIIPNQKLVRKVLSFIKYDVKKGE